MSAFALALALAAQAPPEPYRAQGNGPAWTLTIGGGRMRYEPQRGAAIEVRAPSARVSEFGTREYRTNRLRVSILVGSACLDRASNRRYADQVFVQIDRAELGGCGGAVLAADDLTDTSWAFVEIDGTPVTPTMSGYSLDLSGDNFLGYSRCNRFSGGYTRSGASLTFTWQGSTMSRCPPPHDALELHLRRIFSGRAGPVRFSFPDAETLLLTADVTMRLRRIDRGD
jgi:heat shock protein HslJ